MRRERLCQSQGRRQGKGFLGRDIPWDEEIRFCQLYQPSTCKSIANTDNIIAYNTDISTGLKVQQLLLLTVFVLLKKKKEEILKPNLRSGKPNLKFLKSLVYLAYYIF